ncbi:MAG: hypothetical protein ACRDTX_18770 [Pseudonocardiaceae bacterium]
MQPDSEGNSSGSTHPRRLDAPTVDTASKPPDQWLTTALEEYKSLRVEIVDAIEAQRKIMQLGVTGLSVLIGLGLQQNNQFLTVFLLTLLVPSMAIFITAGALGERFRASRASYFLARKEESVNQVLAGSPPALDWERWLRGRSAFILRDRAEFFFAVFSLTTGALGLGFYLLFTPSAQHIPQLALIVPLGVVSLTLWITGPILHFYLLEECYREFTEGDRTSSLTLVEFLKNLRNRRPGRH